MRITVNRIKGRIYPDPKRVITRYFNHSEINAISIIQKILNLAEEDAQDTLNLVLREFAKRHRNITKIFMNNFTKAIHYVKMVSESHEKMSAAKRLLIGAYFTMEYSIESAALFNPSIVEHPDQNDLEEGQRRFIISFRATGESHISSIAFRSGIIDINNEINLDPQGYYVSEAEVIKEHIYDKKEFELILREHDIINDISTRILEQLNDNFNYIELKDAISLALSIFFSGFLLIPALVLKSKRLCSSF